MAMGMVLVGVAVAGKWDASPTDVEVTRLFDASPGELHEQVDDLAEWAARWPEDCATQWEPGPTTAGAEGTGTIRYTFKPLRRRLEMRVTRDEPGHVFEIEHPSKRGWFTQLTYRKVDEGTELVLLTPLNAPPWPFKPVFFNKIRPAMEDCYRRWLDAIPEIKP
ncbi:MAG: SRPBCC family protein [Myxococcota bacterium]